MANVFFGVNIGADYSADKVTVGAATGSTDVELRVAVPTGDGANWPKGELLIAIDKLKERIEDGRFADLTTT